MGVNFMYLLIADFFYLVVDIIGVSLVLELIWKKLIKKQRYAASVIAILLVYVFVITLSRFIKLNVLPIFGIVEEVTKFHSDAFWSIVIFTMILGLASIFKLLKHYMVVELNNKELESRTYEAENKLLKSQINSHFLFNTLNNIDSLIYEDKGKASQAIYLLSKIMRFMLNQANEQRIFLDNEIDYIRDYLQLSAFSFENADYIEFNVEGDTSSKTIEPLLFIPLVENTVKHGKKSGEVPGIKIYICANDTYVELVTINYLKEVKSQVYAGGFGLSNLEKRLNLLYPDNYMLKTEKTGKLFKAHLKINV